MPRCDTTGDGRTGGQAHETVEKCARILTVLIEPGVSNVRVKAVNNQIEITTHLGYGFLNTDSLKMPVMLRRSDLKPVLTEKAAQPTRMN